MRDFLGALLIGVLTVLSCSSEKTSGGISGRYVGTQNFGIGQVSSAMMLSLRQQGSTLAGTVTPPFRADAVGVVNGTMEGNSFRFDASYSNITFHYEGTAQGSRLQGSYLPLGCVMQSSGQPCVTDSNGVFNLQKQ